MGGGSRGVGKCTPLLSTLLYLLMQSDDYSLMQCLQQFVPSQDKGTMKKNLYPLARQVVLFSLTSRTLKKVNTSPTTTFSVQQKKQLKKMIKPYTLLVWMISYISLQIKQPLEGEVIGSHENVFYDFVFKQAYKKFVCFRDPISQLNSSRE